MPRQKPKPKPSAEPEPEQPGRALPLLDQQIFDGQFDEPSAPTSAFGRDLGRAKKQLP
jgi:hypothetical protein